MKISVITICYNDPGIEKTCKSVCEQLFDDFEWVVIDGGSNKETLDIINKYKNKMAVFISEPDTGIYNAMNKGLNHAKNEYVWFLNAGDTFENTNSISQASKYLGKEDIIYGDLKFIKAGKETIEKFPDKIPYGWFSVGYLPHPATLIKKELFDKYGTYNEEHKIVSDWAKWIEFIDINNSTYKHIPLVLAKHNHDGISATLNENQLRERKEVLNKYYGTEIDGFKYKKYFKLLGIPIIKIVKNFNKKTLYLFGFLPIIKKTGRLRWNFLKK